MLRQEWDASETAQAERLVEEAAWAFGMSQFASYPHWLLLRQMV